MARDEAGMLESVPQDAETIREVLAEFEADGYRGQFRPLEGARLQCVACRHEVDAHDVAIVRLRRLEGASDPADMLAVAGLTCVRCGTKGTAVLNYGPESTLEGADVLLALEDRREGT